VMVPRSFPGTLASLWLRLSESSTTKDARAKKGAGKSLISVSLMLRRQRYDAPRPSPHRNFLYQLIAAQIDD